MNKVYGEQNLNIKKPYKKLGLSIGKKKTGGRNNQGKITAYHRGGGNKIRYIYINKSTSDLKTTPSAGLCKYSTGSTPFYSKLNHLKENTPNLTKIHPDGVKNQIQYASGEVRYLVRDPNRTAWIAGVYWSASAESIHATTSKKLEKTHSKAIDTNKWYSYYSNILAPEGVSVGSTITVGSHRRTSVQKGDSYGGASTNRNNLTGSAGSPQGILATVGNQAFLKDLMLGTLVHNIDGKYVRAAGCSGIIISKVSDSHTDTSTRVTVKLQSGQYKVFSGDTSASIGVISNGEHKTRDFRKAGQKRWLGRRPIVRGVAMNPIDHPHGGGEGKSSGGRPSVTPWGKPTKGKPTRSPKKPKIIR